MSWMQILLFFFLKKVVGPAKEATFKMQDKIRFNLEDDDIS